MQDRVILCGMPSHNFVLSFCSNLLVKCCHKITVALCAMQCNRVIWDAVQSMGCSSVKLFLIVPCEATSRLSNVQLKICCHC